ncbi:peptidylprolyl isomerase [Sporosarcina sp. P18a]|uniref:peptidylprolyl isomerase n=1 Tax=Sporosarcina sp. P18a TaxID=2048259 RepID=UPI0018EE0D6E|nr:peptidylprolyl isomerase [Sporosarcina sp. P18a]
MNLAEKLQQINDAIAAIEIGGQEYQIDNRRLRRADLSLLYQRQRELQAQLEAEQIDGSLFGNTSVVFFDRR